MDHHQLPPIGLGGDKDSPTFDTKDHYRLTEKIRQKKGDYIAELGDLVCERIDTDHDLSFLNELENKFNKSTKKGYAITTIDNVITSFVRNFKDGKDVRITSYRNKRIADINNVIRRTLWGDDSDSLYVVGEFIILNDQYSPNGFPIAFNGQTFKIKKISIENVEFIECYILNVAKGINLFVPTSKGAPLYKKQLHDLKELSIASKDWSEYVRFKSQYANISYGYAINNYKIQGSTIDGCYVDLSDILDVKPISAKRKLQAFYVGISRPTTFLAIF